MKGVLIVSAFIFVQFFLAPLPVSFALRPGDAPTSEDLRISASPINDVQGFVGVFTFVIRVTYTIFFLVAVLLLLFAAFTYLTASGDPEKIKTVHKQLIYAAISIAIALMSVGASFIVQDFLGGNNNPSRPSMDPTTNPINGQYAP